MGRLLRGDEGQADPSTAGATAIVTAREADDLLRDAQSFLALVERPWPTMPGPQAERSRGDGLPGTPGVAADRLAVTTSRH